MPSYNYVSLETGEEFTFFRSVHDEKLSVHPETGEEIKQIFKAAPAVHHKGLKKHVRVDYKSPAATACGCASNVALAKQMYTNSRETPRFGSLDSRRTVTGGVKSSSSGCGHSHSHGSSCSHSH